MKGWIQYTGDWGLGGLHAEGGSTASWKGVK